jgi:hypothetical protein
MEPCVGAVVLLAHAKIPQLSMRAMRALAVAAPVQAFWTGTASVKSNVESILSSPAQAAILAEARRSLRQGEVALSDDVGIELAISGRLVDAPFQTTQLVLRGRFPRALWIADVERPEVVALVTDSDILERPLALVDPLHDRYDSELRRTLRAEFELVRKDAGLYVYGRSSSPRAAVPGP